MTMKALSLWQPWASAIAVGAKLVETRDWSTKYRGPLAIHAAKRKVICELMSFHSYWGWIGAMTPLDWTWGRNGDEDIHRLPFGAIVAVCDLVDCRPTASFTQAQLDTPRTPERSMGHLYQWTERQMGNFELGRFGWVLENIRRIDPAVPLLGQRGLFDIPFNGR